MALVTGYIKNAAGAAIPNASVTVLDGYFDATGEGTAAMYNGYFGVNIDPAGEPYALQFSSIGYKSLAVPLSNWQNGKTITLQQSFVTGEEVVVYATPKSKKFPVWLLALPLVAIAANDKKKGKVSGLKRDDVTAGLLLVGGVIALSAGGKILNKLLVLLGIAESKDTKEVEQFFSEEPQQNPWSPEFWKYGPPGQTRILTTDHADKLATGLHNAFGLLNDDEDGIYAIFKSLPTQSCVSFLAGRFYLKYGKDLYSWLRGGSWNQPGFDHLSDAELNRVNRIVLSLPKYW